MVLRQARSANGYTKNFNFICRGGRAKDGVGVFWELKLKWVKVAKSNENTPLKNRPLSAECEGAEWGRNNYTLSWKGSNITPLFIYLQYQ